MWLSIARSEWLKFFAQTDYFPKPFATLEMAITGRIGGGAGGAAMVGGQQANAAERTGLVRRLMLDTWNQTIFAECRSRLLDAAMQLLTKERLGDVPVGELLVGVRDSFGDLILIILSFNSIT